MTMLPKDMGLELGVRLLPGIVDVVNGVDGSEEASPEDVSFDVTFWDGGVPYKAAGVANVWRLHDNTIDGVSAKVYPIKAGTPIIVWKSANIAYVMFPERIALRACPEA